MNMAVKITNKDVIQSYLMTVSKYDFSVYEKRILYRLVEAMQCELEGKNYIQVFESKRISTMIG